jgi:hypothetical protein
MTEHDDTVSRRYRELPAEEPPRALDEAILAASRRAALARPAPLVAPAGRQRWYVPLAAAAVIVLAVGLTLRVQLEQPADDRMARMERAAEPAPARAQAPAAVAEAKKEMGQLEDRAREKAEEKPAAAPAPRQPAKQRRAEEAVPAPFPAQAGARVAPAAPAPQADARPAELAMAQRDRPERQVASAAGATAAAKVTKEADETPAQALARIAELRKAGKHDEADKALAEFRKRFPDYRIPEATRERVERPPAR